MERQIRDNVNLAHLVRGQDCQSRGRRFDSGNTPKPEISNLHGFEVHRPLNKGTKLLFQEIKASINQSSITHIRMQVVWARRGHPT